MEIKSYYESLPPLKNNFSVKFNHYDQDVLLPHWHEHIELLYFLEGECALVIGGKHYTARVGDTAVVNSGQIHSFTALSPTSYYCMIIYPEFWGDLGGSLPNVKNAVYSDPYVGECMYHINEESKKDDTGSAMMLKAHTYRLMAHLIRTHAEPCATDEERRRERVVHGRLEEVMMYVGEHLSAELSTALLAETCHLTESHFCRFFKRETGKTPMQYVNGLRIERAAVLLSSSDEPISSIAFAVGFHDANYFARVFKTAKGLSPAEYRKKSVR